MGDPQSSPWLKLYEVMVIRGDDPVELPRILFMYLQISRWKLLNIIIACDISMLY
jgi:hypothetical protein